MIFRGVPLPSMFFSLPVGTLDLLFGGGGGGIFCAESIFFLCFIYRYFGFAVLVLEVCSISI